MVYGIPWTWCRCRVFRFMMYCSIFAGIVTLSRYSGIVYFGMSFQSMEWYFGISICLIPDFSVGLERDLMNRWVSLCFSIMIKVFIDCVWVFLSANFPSLLYWMKCSCRISWAFNIMCLRCLWACRRLVLIIFMSLVVVFGMCCEVSYDCNFPTMLVILVRLIDFFNFVRI